MTKARQRFLVRRFGPALRVGAAAAGIAVLAGCSGKGDRQPTHASDDAHPEPGGSQTIGAVRLWTISYRAHDGRSRAAFALAPAWYGGRRHPSLPLIISPHGRGVDGLENARLWGQLPARGRFVVISPDGEGEHLPLYSWGARGQVADLATIPRDAHKALPWLRIDAHRIYAVGGSMGGQEVLLLVARAPRLLAGAATLTRRPISRANTSRFRDYRATRPACDSGRSR